MCSWCKRYRACKWVTIHGETPRDWSWLGTGHKNNILTMDDIVVSDWGILGNQFLNILCYTFLILNVRFNIEFTTLS